MISHRLSPVLTAAACLASPALSLSFPWPWASLLPSAASPAITPTIDNMTMHGTGCLIGGGAAVVRQFRDGLPVFTFPDWKMSVPVPDGDSDSSGSPGAVEADGSSEWKFCSEHLSLGSIPPGNQVRIASVSVGGWADLDQGTTINVTIRTRYGHVRAGTGTSILSRGDLKDNAFNATIKTAPEIWSPCVNSTGKIDLAVIRTIVSLNGTKQDDGKFSGGVLGGDKGDMKKALTLAFTPVWQACTLDEA